MSSAAFANKNVAPAPKANAPAKNGGLRIGEPDDSFEREADRVADEIMSSGVAKRDWSLSRMSAGSPLQRKCACGGPGGESGQCEPCKEKDKAKDSLQRKAAGPAASELAPPIVQEVLQSPGHPLGEGTRRFFSSRFGYDFSRVRVHNDSRAAQSAEAINALAYTAGSSVVFAEGKYAPDGPSGRQLLAHELAHVVQQESATATTGDYALLASDHHAEREAYDAGRLVANGGQPTITSIIPSQRIGRAEKGGGADAPPGASPGPGAGSPSGASPGAARRREASAAALRRHRRRPSLGKFSCPGCKSCSRSRFARVLSGRHDQAT